MNTKNPIQSQQIDEATRNLEDLTFRLLQLNRIVTSMKTETRKVINKRFWDKYFLVIPEQKDDGDNWTRKPYHEFTLSETRYNFEKDKKRIMLGRTSHITKYDGTINNIGQQYGDFYEILVPSCDRLEIIKAIETEIEKLETWKKEKEIEIEKMGQVDEVQLLADLKAVYQKHGQPARIWDKMLDSHELSSYNLTKGN